jgi:hypothetical protein
VEYCDTLDLAGHGPGSWRLPTISELRTLITGCPATGSGGPCGVTDTCMDADCSNDSCDGCMGRFGEGDSGSFWPAELHGATEWIWSSSWFDWGSLRWAWFGNFFGGVYMARLDESRYARCVRPGP